MPKRTEVQLARTDLLDTVRTIVRLKGRVAQRRELNELEAEALEAFEAAVVAGRPFNVDAAAVFKDLA